MCCIEVLNLYHKKCGHTMSYGLKGWYKMNNGQRPVTIEPFVEM